MSKVLKLVLIVIFLLGLVYLAWPGPSAIENFPPVPNSVKSALAGDNIGQNPNITAYFSNWPRADITHFYYKNFSYLKIFGVSIPPLFINHPPEEAFQYVRDQQESTYLEEYFYPFRDQIFVNGWEPIDKNGVRFRSDWKTLIYDDQVFFSKATVRYYPSKLAFRLMAYMGIWAGAAGLFWLARRIKRELS